MQILDPRQSVRISIPTARRIQHTHVQRRHSNACNKNLPSLQPPSKVHTSFPERVSLTHNGAQRSQHRRLIIRQHFQIPRVFLECALFVDRKSVSLAARIDRARMHANVVFTFGHVRPKFSFDFLRQLPLLAVRISVTH